MKKISLVINEIDCYIGNAHNISSLATHRATQHQILLKINNKVFSVGHMGRASDDDRGEQFIKEVEVNKDVASLFNRARKKAHTRMSIYCDTPKENDEMIKFNKPIKKEIKEIIRKIYKLENLGIDFETFHDTLFWF